MSSNVLYIFVIYKPIGINWVNFKDDFDKKLTWSEVCIKAKPFNDYKMNIKKNSLYPQHLLFFYIIIWIYIYIFIYIITIINIQYINEIDLTLRLKVELRVKAKK